MKSLKSHFFEADFDEKRGDWLDLKFVRAGKSIALGGKGPAFDLLLDGKPLWGQKARKTAGFRFFAEGRGGAFIYEIDDLAVTYSLELEKTSALFYQSVLVKSVGKRVRGLDAVLYSLPSVRVGAAGECLLYGGDGKTGLPYPQAVMDFQCQEPQTIEVKPGQQAALTMYNPSIEAGFSAKLMIDPIPAQIKSDGKALTLIQPHPLECTLQPGKTIISQGLCFFFSLGTLKAHRTALKAIDF